MSSPVRNETSSPSSTHRSRMETALPFGAMPISGAATVTSMKDNLLGEVPTMRSVTIGLPHKEAVFPHKFGAPLGITRPTSLKNRDIGKKVGFGPTTNYPFQENDSTKLPFGNGSVKPKPIPSSNWKVPNGALECVPEHFILERTSRFIGCTNASIVSTRISDCLRNRSIEACYDDMKAKAKCKNADLVKFRIRLFAGRDEYKHGVIVEVQRRRGSVVSFMKDCRSILDAAEGEEEDEYVDPFTELPVSEMKFIRHIEGPVPGDNKKEESSRSLQEAVCLIQHDRKDLNMLGVEMLSTLSNPTKSSPEVAFYVAKGMFEEKNMEALRNIASLMQFGVLPGDEEDSDGEGEFNYKLRNLALVILRNALEVTAKNGSLAPIVENQSWFVEKFIPILIEELKHSKTRPHDAALAATCLNLLAGASIDAKKKASETGVMVALTEAKEFGIGNHVLLANEVGRCKLTLECH